MSISQGQGRNSPSRNGNHKKPKSNGKITIPRVHCGPPQPSKTHDSVNVVGVVGVVGSQKEETVRAKSSANGNGRMAMFKIAGTTDDVFVWDEDQPAGTNAAALGRRLASHDDLFRQPGYGNGLMLVLPNGKCKVITKGVEFASILMARVPVEVKKDGKKKGNRIAATDLNTMLGSEIFLSQFRTVDLVARTPMFLSDWSLIQSGYNDGGEGHRIYYVGKPPQISDTMEVTEKFLGAMDFETNADRTNAVAAAITVMLRNFWPGGKPVLAVTANKSHAGKGTVIQFAAGEATKTTISWQAKGWPVERAAVGALTSNPDTAVLVLDNARLDKGDTQIASQFVERITTDPEPFLFSTGTGAPVNRKNNFVLAITTNFGSFCEDILNRSIRIHLLTVGDVAARHCPIGNPSHEFLPANKEQISAELRGMVVRWVKAGCPLDTNVRHPFSEWAKVVGGILMVNGFKDFLGNYGARKAVDDPVRKGLGLLGAAKANVWLRATDWAKLAVDLGLKKAVIPAADQENEVSQARGIGVVLTDHQDETVEAETDTAKLALRLEKKRNRFDEAQPHVRYRFVVVGSGPLSEDGGNGTVLAGESVPVDGKPKRGGNAEHSTEDQKLHIDSSEDEYVEVDR